MWPGSAGQAAGVQSTALHRKSVRKKWRLAHPAAQHTHRENDTEAVGTEDGRTATAPGRMGFGKFLLSVST